MATFWMTEVMPLAVTAMLPVVIFPWLGIMDTKDVCRNYLKVGQVIGYIYFIDNRYSSLLLHPVV